MSAVAEDPALAFEALVRAHEREVRRLCRALVRDEAAALDAAQETFLRLWRRLAAHRPLAEPRAWLRRAALSVAIDAGRRRAAGPALQALAAADEAPAEPEAREPEPEDALARLELVERYERALAELSERQRAVFLLRHEAGLALAEVAALLELEVTSVKTHFTRACRALQAGLRAYAPGRAEGGSEGAGR